MTISSVSGYLPPNTAAPAVGTGTNGFNSFAATSPFTGTLRTANGFTGNEAHTALTSMAPYNTNWSGYGPAAALGAGTTAALATGVSQCNQTADMVTKIVALGARMVGTSELIKWFEKKAVAAGTQHYAKTKFGGVIPAPWLEKAYYLKKGFNGPESPMVKLAGNLHYGNRIAAAWDSKSLKPLLNPNNLGLKQRLMQSANNFFLNNMLGRSFFMKDKIAAIPGAVLFAFTGVSLLSKTIQGAKEGAQKSESSLGGLFGGIIGGIKGFCCEAVKTIAAYKVADIAFLTAKFALTRLAPAFAVANPIAATLLSIVPMAFASLSTNVFIDKQLEKLKA